MFGDLIYFNKNKIEQYSALIREENIEVKESEENISNKKANYLLKCSEFERLLQQRDDYFDYVDVNQEILIKDVRISSIIRVTGEIYVPEQFDIIQLIDEYKSQFLSELDYKDKEEQELLNAIFKNTKMRIPIYCELNGNCDYWLGIGKAIPDNLLIEYNELEDYEGKEVTIIAKLEARKFYKDKPLSVFDIYKDFLGFNRTLRKQMVTNQRQEFESIDVEEDYLSLELLAIYG
ncbi:MAG: hypothetical protein E7244_11910 [Enterocloster citroniae]|nr:hypothetical protein [Enterocloster citroniae]